MFDKFEKKYIITGKIKTTTAIHIGGSSNTFEPNGVDNVVLKDKNGYPFIPGSSLKGVLRSYLERVLKGIGREDVCTISKLCSEKYNNKESKDKKWAEIEKTLTEDEKNNKQMSLSKAIYDDLCEICHLFGSQVSAAKLMIRDSKVIKESFDGFEYRSGNAIDRDKNKTINGALYELEVVPADTEFEFMATLENPDDKDLKNTAFLIKSMEEGDIFIGGNISRGLGGFILKDIKIQYIDKNNIMDSIIRNEKKEISLEDFSEKIG